MPQRGNTVNSIISPHILKGHQTNTNRWTRVRQKCERHNTCSDWVEGPDFPSFEDAPQKQAKVEGKKKKRPDADPEDEDFCAGELCDAREECVKVHGHEADDVYHEDWWFTCCPKDLPVAGYEGMCCKKVNKETGICAAPEDMLER